MNNLRRSSHAMSMGDYQKARKEKYLEGNMLTPTLNAAGTYSISSPLPDCAKSLWEEHFMAVPKMFLVKMPTR